VASAIEIAGVSKRFRLHHAKYDSLKERVIHLGRIPYDDFWALRDIDFEISEGETFGLLGANGSGKSTLLKCIAGILQPTDGHIKTVGRLAALLELGAGFHPELTGRENIFLNASILGLSKRQIAGKFDEIVAFAELETFIDNQVKYYSSGMYIRLGFAVAVNMEPEILLVDEVLAVGDEAFQRKCLDRVRQFQRDGRTIVFVTHSADLVREICDRAAVLDHGLMVGFGLPGEAVRTYREHLLPGEAYAPLAATATEAGSDEEEQPEAPPRGERLWFRSVEMEYPGAGERPYLLAGEPLTVRVEFEASEPVEEPNFGISVYDSRGRHLFGTNTVIERIPTGTVAGRGEVRFVIDSVPLLDGTYLVTLGATDADGGTVYEWREQQESFEVMNPGRTVGLVRLPLRIEVSGPGADEAAGRAGG
jgi:ABC-2 type transport system ATP-binding protein